MPIFFIKASETHKTKFMKRPYFLSPITVLFVLFALLESASTEPQASIDEPETHYCASDFVNHQHQLAHPEVGQQQQDLEKS